MKKIGKILILALAALMVFSVSLLAACGSGVKLTFSMEGAPLEDIVIEAEKGETVEAPSNPVWEGHAFLGWTTEKGGTVFFDGKAPEKDATYYAKWEQAYALTLDLDGGTYAGSVTLWLAEGDSLFSAVKDIVPAKEGFGFGGWFKGSDLISESDKMPASALTLTAKYTVEYTIEVYLQNVGGTNYIRDYEKDVFGSDLVGKTLEPSAPAIPHFNYNSTHKDTINKRELSAGENIFRFYYDRELCVVDYDANAPMGTVASGDMEGAEIRYEGMLKLSENGYSVMGYRFAGWSKSQDGSQLLLPGEEIEIEENMHLYAVWDRGYTDRSGGEDLIYFPRAEEDVAILWRGGHEFRGVREGDSFSFTISSSRKLEGKVFGTKFSYKAENVAGKYVWSDHYGKETDESVTLEIDAYLNAVYTKDGTRHEGAVEYSFLDGDYIFSSGDGEFFHTFFLENEGKKIFLVGGDEAGVYMDFWIIDAETGSGISNGDILLLDGYGSAAVYKASAMGYIVFEGIYEVEGSLSVNQEVMYRIKCTIDDELGILGTPGQNVYYLYTMPLNAEYDGYVFADTTIGEYAVEEKNGTLVLDGFGFFGDSAVYREGETVFTGTYTFESDYKTGTVVTMTYFEGGRAAGTLCFRLDLNSFKAERLADDFRKNYEEYYLLNDGFDYPLLVVYEEKLQDGFKAELYASQDEGKTVELAATGVCTAEEFAGGMKLYHFKRTEAHNGYDLFVAEEMTFYLTTVFGSGDLREHVVYCLLSYNKEVYYQSVTLSDGGEIWYNTRVSIVGVGSLYFPKGREGGEVIEGSFSWEENPYFGGNYGEFVYGTAEGNVILQYEITIGADGALSGKPAERSEIVLYTYYRDETNHAEYVNDLVLDGKGNAAFNDDHGYGNWQRGSYSVVDRTKFGDDIYSLKVGGEERFRFLIYLMEDAGGNALPIYFIYNEAADKEYQLTGGGELVLDGFCVASYTDADGNYSDGTFSLNEAGNLVYFTADNGVSVYISLTEDGKATALDDSFGDYYLVDASYNQINYLTVSFDGRGNLTIKSPTGSASEGWYEAIGTGSEYEIHGNFGSGATVLRVRLAYLSNSGTYVCVLLDEKFAGEFIDEDWNVLLLNGYGEGSISAPGVGVFGAGEYAVLDEEKGFISFLPSESASEIYLVINFENRSFELIDYSKFGYIYFSETLDYIVFGDDGIARLGGDSGFYFVDGEQAYFYLYSYLSENFSKKVLPAPTGSDTYTYNGATYYLWKGGELKIEGEIEFLDEKGEAFEKHPTEKATFTLTPRADRFYNLEASFVIGEQTYKGFVFNFQTEGKFRPRVVYDGLTYYMEFSYHGGQGDTFSVKAGYSETELMDYYSAYRDEEGGHRGGKIVRKRIGFGPYILEAPTYSGWFLYLNPDFSKPAEPLTFENVPFEKLVIVGNRAGLGACYEVVFKSGDKRYAVDFYETYAEEIGACYVLQSLYEYEEYESELEGFQVGLKYLLYSNVANTPGYGDENAKGKVCAATLLKDGKAIVSLDNGILLDGNGVWTVDSVQPQTGRYQAYVLELVYGENGRVESAKLNTYWFMSVSNSDYLFYLAVNENGEIVKLLACAYNSNGAYTWLSGGDVAYDDASHTYSFTAFVGTKKWKLTVRFNHGGTSGSGNPIYTFFVTEEEV